MTIEQNKATARRLIENVWNNGMLATLDEVMAPTVVSHNLPAKLPATIEGFKQFVKMYRTAFPDLHFAIDDLVGEGDKIAMRWTATGTHKGQLMNFSPTARKGTVTGMSMSRYDAKGKIVENWFEFDQLSMLQQLGLMPMPA